MLRRGWISALQANAGLGLHSSFAPSAMAGGVKGSGSSGVAAGRRMTIKLGVPTGTKKRSIEEQLKKLKEQQEGRDGDDASGGGGSETSQRRDGPMKGGTMTLAMRLSQSLKDPLRSKDFLGQISKGEIQVECHHHSKFLWLKNQRGILSEDAITNLIELIQISDTNWYERFGVFKGGEASFCGGADVRGLASMGMAPSDGPCPQMEAQRGKYQLCHLIAKSPKPRIALLDGNCLGAGAGLAMAHNAVSEEGSPQHFRIATDRTVFSLQSLVEDVRGVPLVSNVTACEVLERAEGLAHAHFLGTFPGFGLSYFLPRLRGHIGLYLALTGQRINGADCLFAGVASHFMAQHRVDRCMQAITHASADITEAQLKQILDDHVTTTQNKDFKTYTSPPSFYQRYANAAPEPTHLEANYEAIQRCFGAASVEELLELLEQEDSEWARHALSCIRHMAPLALYVTFRLLRQSPAWSFEESLRNEWKLARRFYSMPDFFEAVRAFEVEKDGNPKWAPAPTAEEVTERAQVTKMFAPMSEAVLRPLKLSQDHLSNSKANFGRGEVRV